MGIDRGMRMVRHRGRRMDRHRSSTIKDRTSKMVRHRRSTVREREGGRLETGVVRVETGAGERLGKEVVVRLSQELEDDQTKAIGWLETGAV